MLHCLLVLVFWVHWVWANTESFLLHVPRDFPTKQSSSTELIQYPWSISLQDTNINKATFSCGINHSSFVELTHLQQGEAYQIKICWTALDPISIDQMDWFVVPHSTSFQGTTSDAARIFVRFDVRADSYPALEPTTRVPINVSVINTKLAIPVDLYKLIVYIGLVTAGVFLVNRKASFQKWLESL
ncbi:PGA1 (YNL158W) [Zygosaccharomyces parabailii]|nr:PGA1 (YNL158W) [Zygosaccharomyces parabailii]CDH09213.1 related to GPI mannosyltransferase 2 subunit PGA1 [Zygosaccharomyces bailii ISA1307]